jgi:hypothetical protein
MVAPVAGFWGRMTQPKRVLRNIVLLRSARWRLFIFAKQLSTDGTFVNEQVTNTTHG